MGAENAGWKFEMERLVDSVENGEVGLDVLAEVLVARFAEATSRRGSDYDLACELAAELERHYDLRNSQWNSPDDVGPEDNLQLNATVSEVRSLIASISPAES